MAGKRINKINLKHIEQISFRLAQEHLAFDEPIPDFSLRYPNILESCVATPFQSFSKRNLYPTLISKAAILFYLMIKNHPFINGNKRIALMSVLVFLRMNDKWLNVDTKSLYNFTLWVAQSPAQLKSKVVECIEDYFNSHLAELSE